MSAPAPSMFSSDAKAVAASLNLKLGKANLDVFATTLQGLAGKDRNILAVTSDSRGSGKLAPFGQALPDQIVEVGIAEQNLVGVAAGLASAGKTVYAVSPACFLSARALEQIKNDVCYSDNRVNLIGISAGVSYGALGTTHHSLHDLAALRAINNIDVIVPADNHEARAAITLAATHDKPTFIRFGKAPQYDLYPAGAGFEIGRAAVIREGSDLCFIGTGETVIHCLLAAEKLKQMKGLNCRVLSMHTIKPFDNAAVIQAARDCGTIVTAEEHLIYGGLGEAVAGVLMQAGVPAKLKIVGIPDEYTVTGAQADIFRHYGLSMEGLTAAATALLK